jgi:hypothetical protein
MTFCSNAGPGDELLRRLGSLSIQDPLSYTRPQKAPTALNNPSVTIKADDENGDRKELSILMMAMRKIREGIVASKRIDDFSIQAYQFCIRATILAKHMESYHPALLHLLYTMHRTQPLSKIDLQEFAGYLVLDLACRQQDLAQAHQVRVYFAITDRKVTECLAALVRDDYDLWWRVRGVVDGHKKRLMEWAEPGVKVQALKCLGRAYLSVDLELVEKVTDETWPTLVADYKVGWELEGGKVVIRKPKAR